MVLFLFIFSSYKQHVVLLLAADNMFKLSLLPPHHFRRHLTERKKLTHKKIFWWVSKTDDIFLWNMVFSWTGDCIMTIQKKKRKRKKICYLHFWLFFGGRGQMVAGISDRINAKLPNQINDTHQNLIILTLFKNSLTCKTFSITLWACFHFQRITSSKRLRESQCPITGELTHVDGKFNSTSRHIFFILYPNRLQTTLRLASPVTVC